MVNRWSRIRRAIAERPPKLSPCTIKVEVVASDNPL